MSKAPSFQFYVKDWLTDVELQSASASSRGIWINALCLMWESRTRGILHGSPEVLARMLNCSFPEFDKFSSEIIALKFADVTLCNGEVTLSNRRMVKEEKARNQTNLRVKKLRSNGGCNAPCNGNVTVPSSSSSPTPKNLSDTSYPHPTAKPVGEKAPPPQAFPESEIIRAYHERLPTLPRVKVLNKTRRGHLRARWTEDKSRQSPEWWDGYFAKVGECPHLLGDNERGWTATWDWLVNQANMIKVLEGNYDRKARASTSTLDTWKPKELRQ